MRNNTRTNNQQFFNSALSNNRTWGAYYLQLVEYALSRFEWEGLPLTVDERMLELSLLSKGQAVFFEDEEIGFLALPVIAGAPFDVYGIPVYRRAYAINNSYQKQLSNKDSIIIFNNMLHINTEYKLVEFAQDLFELSQIIMINAKAQKTPLLILCDEKQRLTLKNLYMKYDGNQPFIFGEKGLIGTDSIKALGTGAPFLCDKLYQLKANIWNEALTFLGITNVSVNKKERLISDEVDRLQGGTTASRFSYLKSREDAAKKINDMYGLKVSVKWREEEGSKEKDEYNDENKNEEESEK